MIKTMLITLIVLLLTGSAFGVFMSFSLDPGKYVHRFAASCAACHGASLEYTPAGPRLITGYLQGGMTGA